MRKPVAARVASARIKGGPKWDKALKPRGGFGARKILPGPPISTGFGERLGNEKKIFKWPSNSQKGGRR